MKGVCLAFFLCLPLGSALAAEVPPDAEGRYQELKAKLEAAKTDSEKLDICKLTLAELPESQHTMDALSAVKQHCAALGKPDEYASTAESTLARVKDPKLAREIRLELLDFYSGNKNYSARLSTLAVELTAGDKVGYNRCIAVAEALCKSELWSEVPPVIERARPFCDMEMVRKDYASRNMSQPELEDRRDYRLGGLFMYGGWAKVNTGQVDAGLCDLAQAGKLVSRNYLGLCPNDLDLFWGRALIRAGKSAEALKLLSAAAIYGDEAAYGPLVKEAYSAVYGDVKNLSRYIADLRAASAKKMVDFTLSDYQNKPFTFSSTKGKVVLLAFWFPT